MISVDWTLGLQFLNFVILLLILNKILYRPLLKIIADRSDRIAGLHAGAKDLEADIDEKMQRYQQQLNDAKFQANEERNKLKQAASEEEVKFLTEARGKASSRLEKIKSQVAVEAGEASKILQTEAGALAEQITTKILGRELA